MRFSRGDNILIAPILIRVGLIDVMITDLGIPIQKPLLNKGGGEVLFSMTAALSQNRNLCNSK